jgi:Gpi18-like mannosyltransferase
MKLLGIISVGFDVTDQLLIRAFAFIRYWREKNRTYDKTVRQLFVDFPPVYKYWKQVENIVTCMCDYRRGLEY